MHLLYLYQTKSPTFMKRNKNNTVDGLCMYACMLTSVQKSLKFLSFLISLSYCFKMIKVMATL